MPIFSNQLAGASGQGGGYSIDQSIRFNDDDTAYLTRTQDTGDSKRIATFSWWMKRGSNFGTESAIIAAGASSRFLARFNTSDQLTLRLTNGTTEYTLITNMVFRDPSAWYHCVWRIDVTQATAADRSRLYVNGSAVTFTGSSLPAQNTDVVGLADATTQRIGILSHTTAASKYDGYLAEFHYIDNASLDASSFGETNDDGVWVPIKYAGTYGTNGFYITGADSADLGADESGNSNDFTSSGLTSADQVLDSPTDNYAVFNNIIKGENSYHAGSYGWGSNTISEGGLKVLGPTGTNLAGATISYPSSGKFYYEATYIGTDTAFFGIADLYDDTKAVWYRSNGWVSENSSSWNTSSGAASYSAGDVLAIAVNMDGNEAKFYKNNSLQSTVSLTAGSTYTPVLFGGNSSIGFSIDFGQLGFTYTPPTGFTALSTANLPAPTINDGSAYFQASLYTGNGTAIGSGGKSVTQDKNSTFQPDFVWIKERNGAADNALYDAVRGTTKDLASNNSSAETTETEGLTAFDAAGFTVGSLARVNTSSDTYAAWQWLAANGTASNSDGSISSTVSANTTAGFSIVTYTGDGNDNATVGHGLGVTPKTVWLLPRSNGDNKQVSNWETGVTPFTEDLKLNAAEVAGSSSLRVKGGSSTTFTLGTDVNVNGSGNTYLAYVWNEVAGFSKFATYTSNGSTDGPFVYCGFRPAIVFIRCTENGENWHMYDSTRNTYNATNLFLYPTTADAEGTSGRDIDILSNGFKLRGTDGGINSASNRKYVAMCFAEHPFGGDGVAPATAR